MLTAIWNDYGLIILQDYIIIVLISSERGYTGEGVCKNKKAFDWTLEAGPSNLASSACTLSTTTGSALSTKPFDHNLPTNFFSSHCFRFFVSIKPDQGRQASTPSCTTSCAESPSVTTLTLWLPTSTRATWSGSNFASMTRYLSSASMLSFKCPDSTIVSLIFFPRSTLYSTLYFECYE